MYQNTRVSQAKIFFRHFKTDRYINLNTPFPSRFFFKKDGQFDDFCTRFRIVWWPTWFIFLKRHLNTLTISFQATRSSDLAFDLISSQQAYWKSFTSFLKQCNIFPFFSSIEIIFLLSIMHEPFFFYGFLLSIKSFR